MLDYPSLNYKLLNRVDPMWCAYVLLCFVLLWPYEMFLMDSSNSFILLWHCGSVGMLDSLCPSDAMWQHRFGSTLAQLMACCLKPPSNYLNQCWLLFSDVLWHLPDSNATGISQGTILYNEFENHTFNITATSSGVQWVNYQGYGYKSFRWSAIDSWYIEVKYHMILNTTEQQAW